ncbi:MAG: hypothetical protein JHC71_09145 [Blastococcus sp.]|nr:hypothetical protein [Blastococcus sp.]
MALVRPGRPQDPDRGTRGRAGPDRGTGAGRSRATSILRFRGDRLVAVETVNRPDDHILPRRILTESGGPTFAEASAAGFELPTWHETSGMAAVGCPTYLPGQAGRRPS